MYLYFKMCFIAVLIGMISCDSLWLGGTPVNCFLYSKEDKPVVTDELTIQIKPPSMWIDADSVGGAVVIYFTAENKTNTTLQLNREKSYFETKDVFKLPITSKAIRYKANNSLVEDIFSIKGNQITPELRIDLLLQKKYIMSEELIEKGNEAERIFKNCVLHLAFYIPENKHDLSIDIDLTTHKEIKWDAH